MNKNAQIAGALRPYMQNLDNHIKIVEAAIDRAGIDGMPLFNSWIQHGRTAIGASPDVAVLDNAIHTMVDEYTRVVTTVTGSGQQADTERKRWLDAINSAMTPEMMHAVLDQVIKRDRQFREQSLVDEQQSIMGALQSMGPTGAISRAAPAAAQFLQPQTSQTSPTTGNIAPPTVNYVRDASGRLVRQ
jgi:hypothetical protein